VGSEQTHQKKVLDPLLIYSTELMKPLKKRTVYKDRGIHVEVTDNPRTWSIMVRPAANLIPVTSEGKILLQHEYKPWNKKWIWGFPGGMIEDGETAVQGAKRECAEELGLKPGKTKVVHIVHTGFPSTSVTYVLGFNLRKVPKANWETEKIGTIKELTIDELMQVARRGEISDPRMEVAVYRLYDAVKSGKITLR
jgi:ADP-ribose pyrophosphatase